ncbi:type I-E CRISPR-associated protein Cse2/CasB [Brevibacterium sp.]|uniref:type I-E CRISPR-associated protein Cse2/CasB n=1 Tax=Brevibacterium sp. TaxID=1701 RepID=UPI00281195D4|nr:type I-E CRISPR-associated protein Cse2/CasB [Brevibacterium sp.]
MTDSNTVEKPALRQVVGKAIASLQMDLLESPPAKSAAARATLAKLRRAAGEAAESNPLAWAAAFDILGESFVQRYENSPSHTMPDEFAAFTALTLYAVHQQSQSKPMHFVSNNTSPLRSFGHAAGELARTRDSNSIKKRFDAIVTTRNASTRLHHLRGLTEILSTDGIGLNYGNHAEDIRSSLFPEWDQTVLRWIRDFARSYNSPKTDQVSK